jgi:hypothetical protein
VVLVLIMLVLTVRAEGFMGVVFVFVFFELVVDLEGVVVVVVDDDEEELVLSSVCDFTTSYCCLEDDNDGVVDAVVVIVKVYLFVVWMG